MMSSCQAPGHRGLATIGPLHLPHHRVPWDGARERPKRKWLAGALTGAIHGSDVVDSAWSIGIAVGEHDVGSRYGALGPQSEVCRWRSGVSEDSSPQKVPRQRCLRAVAEAETEPSSKLLFVCVAGPRDRWKSLTQGRSLAKDSTGHTGA